MKIPFFYKHDINDQAENFRKKNWGDTVPVNIEEIITLKLKIDVIPKQNLLKLCNADAFITAEWKNVYVDNENYMNDKCYNRLRFSLAHEIGHFILHKKLFESFGIKSVPDYYKFIDELGNDYGIIEGHANKFANCLLVPKNKLKLARKKIEEKLFKSHPELKEIDVSTINSYIAAPLAKSFQVNQGVVEISLSDLDDFN